jgi:hypothetical protein
MVRKRHSSKKKKINPKFWVFCEGKTEKAYVEYLRAKYRLPVKIIPEITGSKISDKLISSHISKKEKHPKDKIFLLYDADIEVVLERLLKITKGKLLASNPSIELWFLLHYKNQTANITGAGCIKQLNNRNRNLYIKGVIDDKLKKRLDEKVRDACDRAKRTVLFKNPSTNIFEFIKELDNVITHK